MRSAIVRIDESRVEVELIDLVKFLPEALGWHFRYPHPEYGLTAIPTTRNGLARPCGAIDINIIGTYGGSAGSGGKLVKG
jgi:hypothetical protein